MTPSIAHNETWRETQSQPNVEDVRDVTWSGYDITQVAEDAVANNVTDNVRGYGLGTDIVSSNWHGQIAVTTHSQNSNGSTTTTPSQFPDDYGWISPYENPDSSVTWGVLVAIIVVVICFFVAVILYARYRRVCNAVERSHDESVNGPPSEQTEIMVDSTYDYIYKPVSGGALDDEYETTFVGVSIPLLQEVTRI